MSIALLFEEIENLIAPDILVAKNTPASFRRMMGEYPAVKALNHLVANDEASRLLLMERICDLFVTENGADDRLDTAVAIYILALEAASPERAATFGDELYWSVGGFLWTHIVMYDVWRRFNHPHHTKKMDINGVEIDVDSREE